MRKTIVLILATLAVALACDTTTTDPVGPVTTTPRAISGFPQVHGGMDYSSVVALMGSPTSGSIFTADGITIRDCLWYEMGSDGNWVYYYDVEFTNGIVTSTYSG